MPHARPENGSMHWQRWAPTGAKPLLEDAPVLIAVFALFALFALFAQKYGRRSHGSHCSHYDSSRTWGCRRGHRHARPPARGQALQAA